MLSLALIAGLWTTTCLQTQINQHQGYVIESYNIRESGDYEFAREWYKDSKCISKDSVDEESGSLNLGQRLSGIFVSGQTYEADFSSQSGIDLGAIQVNASGLKIARGQKNTGMRNTMISVFEYAKN